MNDNLLKKLAAQVVDGVDIAQVFKDARAAAQEDQINFWVPAHYKARYKQLQKQSKFKFGRLVKEVIMKCIDSADQERAS